MKVLLLILALSISVQAKGLFEFKKYTLNTFNEARRLLAAGSLKTIADIINKAVPKAVPDFGPASNMYKLKWSAKLEHKAYLYGKGKSPLPDITLDSFKYKGLVGFQWPGLITEIVEKVLGYVLPWDALKDAIMSFVNLFEGILMALLIVKNFPPENGLVTENDNLGATEILFAHRYEIGCYTKVVYSICFMEPSRNGGRMFKKGVPCSECPTHCEFFEDDNGFIEEGDMCVPPREESNTTAALVVKQEQYVVANASMIPSILMIIIFVISIYLK